MGESTVALVTGANKGIGFETCRQLAQQGITVLLGSRDPVRGEAAAAALRGEGLDVRCIALDLADRSTIDAAVAAVDREFGRLDILVNNAGVNLDRVAGATKPTSETSLETYRATFETNFFNTIAVTQAFLPLIRRSAAGRIVNLSSVLGSISLHADPGSYLYDVKVPAYDTSKSALNAFTVHLAHELKDTGIKVNAAHPGWVKTDMGGPNAPLSLEEGARTSVRLATLPSDGPTGGYFHLDETLPW